MPVCIASGVRTLTTSEGVLLLGRTIAGIGGGGIYAIATFVRPDLIPLRKRGIALGANNTMYGFGLSIGGILGGWIADSTGWKWVFLIQVPFIHHCPSLLCSEGPPEEGAYTFESNRLSRLRALDNRTGIAALGLNAGGNLAQWTSPLVLTTLPLSGVCLAGFVWWETKSAVPIIPVPLFLHQTVAAACLTYPVTLVIDLSCVYVHTSETRFMAQMVLKYIVMLLS